MGHKEKAKLRKAVKRKLAAAERELLEIRAKAKARIASTPEGQQPDERDPVIVTLSEENIVMREMLAELLVKSNSQNSSTPPSADQPSAPERPEKPPTGRKPGGQPGHKRNTRPLIPTENCDQVIPCRPPECRGCGTGLQGDDPDPKRHQVTDLPPVVRALVKEYQIHSLVCPNCNAVTVGDLPEGVSYEAFGPKLVAFVAVLTGAFRLSKRLAQELLTELYGVEMSLGSISECEQKVSAALKEPVEEAREFVKKQNVKHADETSWYEGIKRLTVWLWVVTTGQVTVFLIHATRKKLVAKGMLGKAFGVLVSDRWSAYNWWPKLYRQLCWAHIKRHFQKFIDTGGDAKVLGEALMAEHTKLFEMWHRVRDGTLKHARFRKDVKPIRHRIRELLGEGCSCSHIKTARVCRNLMKLELALWSFVRYEGVEPTNNNAERAIRFGVVWRKLSFGTHSEAGSRFVERMLTVRGTLRLQKRGLADYVVDAVNSSVQGNSPPSLIPAQAQA